MTRIGLLSDSHGRAGTTRAAMQRLLAEGVDRVLHLGDVGSVEVIDALVEQVDAAGELRPPVHVVFGNCDWDAEALGRYAESLGIAVDHPVGRLEADGATVVYQHGHQESAMEQALAEGVAYLCHGHTHRPRDERAGATRLVNPGALFRAAKYTVAVLDTARGTVEFFGLAPP
jgi:putative phosphoesterase